MNGIFFLLKMPKTFDYYRSTNNRLHAALDKQDHYERYLKRIESIVSRKPRPDLSTSNYMSFANRCHEISKHHRSQQHLSQVNTENQILLDKIITAKKRRFQLKQDRYMVALHEKRYRWQEQINEQNKKIALRVINQNSTIDSRPNSITIKKESPKRVTEKTFYQSRVKDRQLPKLMQIEQ